jgi:integrase
MSSEEMKETDKAQQFLDHIAKSKSKNTLLVYRGGLSEFLTWIGKDGNTVLAEHKENRLSADMEKGKFFDYKIDEYYAYLVAQGFSKNSARVKTNGITAFFRYYGLPVELSAQTTKVIETDVCYVPEIEELQKMFNHADIRGKVLISLALDVPVRAGDFITIKKDQIDLTREPPTRFVMQTSKEDVLIKTFLSAETIELLKSYIPTLKPENPYIFQNGNGGHLSDDAINGQLQTLAKEVGIAIPKGQRLSFHAFRKLVYSTCADCHFSVHLADMLVGKTVPRDKSVYLGKADLKAAFLEVHKRLSLTNGRMTATVESKDKEIAELRSELNEQKLLLRAMTQIFGNEILEKAKLSMSSKMRLESVTPMQVLENLARGLAEQEKEEYRKRLENNNGNGGNA